MSGDICIQTDALNADLVSIVEVLNEIELGARAAQLYGNGLLLFRLILLSRRSETNTTAR